MKDFTLIFIFLCFIIQIIFWIVTAFSTKRTSENKGGWIMRIIAIIIVGSVFFLNNQIINIFPFLKITFWSFSSMIGIITDIIIFSGMMIMIWARLTLGRNWSANVVFKEDHELIKSGPYAYVRHPIYSGLLLMILACAIYFATLLGFIIFVMFFVGAYYKACKEEKLLIKYFPEQYAVYKKQVHALIPFVF